MIVLSEERAAELLVGWSVSISVGEPWDFASSDGENVLRGRITQVLTDSEDPAIPNSQEVWIEVTPFFEETGHRIDRLKATARHVDEVGIIERLIQGGSAEANLSYSDQIPRAERDPKSTPKLIGGFELAPH